MRILSSLLSARTMASSTSASASASNVLNWASTTDGAFRRKPSAFREAISAQPGARFPPEKNRYYLFASLACPWAHRALIVRQLKGLDSIIPVAYVHPFMGTNSWTFDGEGYQGQGLSENGLKNITGDPLFNSQKYRELYFKAEPEYEGRFTVPMLWDTKENTIVNNESAEIIRFLNTEFDSLLPDKYKNIVYYPEELRTEIDSINEWVYDTINNGVYKSGFATKEAPYIENVTKLFASLDRVEAILAEKYKSNKEAFLVGDKLTEADIRLFTTIVRFDPVYYSHFKCNINTIRSGYPNINRWMRNLYWNYPAFKDTTDFDHIKIHYYSSHVQINPTSIVPVGPIPNIQPL